MLWTWPVDSIDNVLWLHYALDPAKPTADHLKQDNKTSDGGSALWCESLWAQVEAYSNLSDPSIRLHPMESPVSIISQLGGVSHCPMRFTLYAHRISTMSVSASKSTRAVLVYVAPSSDSFAWQAYVLGNVPWPGTVHFKMQCSIRYFSGLWCFAECFLPQHCACRKALLLFVSEGRWFFPHIPLQFARSSQGGTSGHTEVRTRESLPISAICACLCIWNLPSLKIYEGLFRTYCHWS